MNCRPLLVLVVLGSAGLAVAQDLSVSTRLAQKIVSPAGGVQEEILVRSLTLFHTGRVYDYLQGTQEVTIYDGSQKKFLILHLGRKLATEITQDEVRQFLELASVQVRERIKTAKDEGSPDRIREIQVLQMQLQPTFEEIPQPKDNLLNLHSPVLDYHVETLSVEAGIVEEYLRYADATAELNSVLHPHALLPAPRQQLNQALRERQALPRQVELTIQGESPICLKAEHKWTWKLSPTDRQLIHHWEAMLKSGDLRAVPFREFQQQTLQTASRR